MNSDNSRTVIPSIASRIWSWLSAAMVSCLLSDDLIQALLGRLLGSELGKGKAEIAQRRRQDRSKTGQRRGEVARQLSQQDFARRQSRESRYGRAVERAIADHSAANDDGSVRAAGIEERLCQRHLVCAAGRQTGRAVE